MNPFSERETAMTLISRLFLSALLLTGCARLADSADDEDPPRAVAQLGATSFTVDSSALATIPGTTLPAQRLRLDQLTLANMSQSLLGAMEAPSLVSVRGPQRNYRTLAWEFSIQLPGGFVSALSSAPPGAPVDLTAAELQTRTLARLSQFGLPTTEVGRALPRQAVTQSEEGGAAGPTYLHSYKTFVFRAFNGVEVEGHRAVLSHGRDGKLRKVTMRWPALAEGGHLLRTPLTRAQIEQRAVAALSASGETGGAVHLSWRYVAVPTSTGEVTLKLTVAAHLAQQGSEARIIDVDVAPIS